MFRSAWSGRRKGGAVTACAVDGCEKPRRRKSGARYCEEHATCRDYRLTGAAHTKYRKIDCELCGAQAKVSRQSTYVICNECVEPRRGLINAARNHGVPWEILRKWLSAPSCELCRRPLYVGKGKGGAQGFAVDHNHNCCPGGTGCTKCIRGLLCGACNTQLGSMESLMRRASMASLLAYIDRGAHVEHFSDEHHDHHAA